jgi:predicted Zn-dependent protease with MMP-like domain
MRSNRRLTSATWNRLLAMAEGEVLRVLNSLPENLRAAAEALTMVYENCPARALVQDGIEPDTLGLFVGDAFGEAAASSSVLPPQIILYLENLWAAAEGDEAIFREEVRTTWLHELGHFLGLDEDGLIDRGLE